MGKIKKSPLPNSLGSIHKQHNLPENNIKLSFKYFATNKKYHVDEVQQTYLIALLDRFRSICCFTIQEFRTNKLKSLRAHQHDWERTTEKEGYTCLNEQLRQCEPWQFQLSANEHGRVHGILLDEVFYVVWLDPSHRLYD